jgi:hypothetical protein
MSRRMSNNHKIVKGAFRHKIPGAGSHTSSGLGRTYFAIPPAEGWPGGAPEKNGYKG